MFAKPAERARGAFHHVPAGQLLVAAANSPSVRPSASAACRRRHRRRCHNHKK